MKHCQQESMLKHQVKALGTHVHTMELQWNQLFHLALLYFTNFTHRIEITMRSGVILCNVALNVAMKVCIDQTTFELCWQDDV